MTPPAVVDTHGDWPCLGARESSFARGLRGVYACGLRPPPPRCESLGAMRLPATECVLG